MRVATTATTAGTATMTMVDTAITAGTMLALITRNKRTCSNNKASLVKLEGLFSC